MLSFRPLIFAYVSQVTLVAAVASVRGHDVTDPSVILMMLGVLGGDIAAHSVANAAQNMGMKGAQQFFKKAGAKAVKQAIDKAVLKTVKGMLGALGVHSTRGLTKVVGAVPFVGGLVGFAVDGGMCYAFAKGTDFALLDHGA